MKNKRFLITEDGSHTLYVPELDETYHSIHGARQESEHVFIQHGLRYTVQQLNKKKPSVLEVGFGTGLNAWLTAMAAQKLICPVSYTTIEAHPLTGEEVQSLNYPALATHQHEAEIFFKIHESAWEDFMEISPFFLLKKVCTTLQEYKHDQCFDICYFDAFAPSKQPEMWHIDMLKKVAGCLRDEGVFVTYCAKGQLKRDLKSLGFEVETLEGPPGKKEMVRAVKR